MSKNLHLGCWKRDIPDFINIDLCDLPHIDFRQDIKDLSNFYNNSVDYIYCSHAFEYFDKIESIKALKEWQRVLRPNGILRIAVPDFNSLCEVYAETQDLSLVKGALLGQWNIENTDVSIFHKAVYDYKTLSELLQEVGFKNIKRYNWRDTFHASYDDHSQAYIPHMDKEKGKLISLNIECRK